MLMVLGRLILGKCMLGADGGQLLAQKTLAVCANSVKDHLLFLFRVEVADPMRFEGVSRTYRKEYGLSPLSRWGGQRLRGWSGSFDVAERPLCGKVEPV